MEFRDLFDECCNEIEAPLSTSLDEIMMHSQKLYRFFSKEQQTNADSKKLLEAHHGYKGRRQVRQCSPNRMYEIMDAKAPAVATCPSSSLSVSHAHPAAQFLEFVEHTCSAFETVPAIEAIKRNISIAVKYWLRGGERNSVSSQNSAKKLRRRREKGSVGEHCSLPPKYEVIASVVERFKKSTSYSELQRKCLEALEVLHEARTISTRGGTAEGVYFFLPESADVSLGDVQNEIADNTASSYVFTIPNDQKKGSEDWLFDHSEKVRTDSLSARGGTKKKTSSDDVFSHPSSFPVWNSSTLQDVAHLPHHTVSCHTVEVLNFCGSNDGGPTAEERLLSPVPHLCEDGVEEALFVVRRAVKHALKNQNDNFSASFPSTPSRSKNSDRVSLAHSFSSSLLSTSDEEERVRGEHVTHMRMEHGSAGEEEERRKRCEERPSIPTALEKLVEAKMIDALVEESDLYWEGLVAVILQMLKDKSCFETPLYMKSHETDNAFLSSEFPTEVKRLLERLVMQLREVGSAFQLNQFIIDLLYLLEKELAMSSERVSEGEAKPDGNRFTQRRLSSSTVDGQGISASTASLLRRQQGFEDPGDTRKVVTHASERQRLVVSLALKLIDFLPQCWINLVDEEVEELLYFIFRISLRFSSLFTLVDSQANWLERWIAQRSCVAKQLSLLPVACQEEFTSLFQYPMEYRNVSLLSTSSVDREMTVAGGLHDCYRLAVVSLILPLVCGVHLSPSPPPTEPLCSPHVVIAHEQQEWVEECVRVFLFRTFSFSSMSYLLKCQPSSLSMIIAGCYHSRHRFSSSFQSSLLSQIVQFLLSLSPCITGINDIVEKIDPLSLNRVFQLALIFLIRSDNSISFFGKECDAAFSRRSFSCCPSSDVKEKMSFNENWEVAVKKLDDWVSSLLQSVINALYERFVTMLTSTERYAPIQQEDVKVGHETKFQYRSRQHSWITYRQYLHVLMYFCINALPHLADQLSNTLAVCLQQYSNPSLYDFFLLLSPSCTESEFQKPVENTSVSFCPFCPSFSQIIVAASFHPYGWVRIREWCLLSTASFRKKSGAPTACPSTLSPSGFIPLVCLSTYELLFSILTMNEMVAGAHTMLDDLPLYSPVHHHPYFHHLRRNAKHNIHRHHHASTEMLSLDLDRGSKTSWLSFLSALSSCPSSLSFSSSPLWACRCCTTAYRSASQDWPTAHLLFQRWSTVSNCFLRPSLSEVAEEVCDVIASALVSSSFTLPDLAVGKQNLFRMFPFSQEALHWASMYENQERNEEMFGRFHPHGTVSSFSSASLLRWQSLFHFLLVLETPFPARGFFSPLDQASKDCFMREKFNVNIAHLKAPREEKVSKNFLSRASLLSRATAQLKVWCHFSQEMAYEHLRCGSRNGSSGRRQGNNSLFLLNSDCSGLFSTLALIAWGLWMHPMVEDTFTLRHRQTVGTVRSTVCDPSHMERSNRGTCSEASGREALEVLLMFASESLSETYEENTNERAIVDPVAILLATIIVSFGGVSSETTHGPCDKSAKGKDENNTSVAQLCLPPCVQRDAPPFFSSAMLAALAYLLRDGVEVDWRVEVLEDSVWESLIRDGAKIAQSYRHDFTHRAFLADVRCQKGFRASNDYDRNVFFTSPSPTLSCSIPLICGSTISSSLVFVEHQLNHNSHWKAWKEGFFPTSSSPFFISHFQKSLALLLVEEKYCRHAKLEGSLKKASSSKKSEGNDEEKFFMKEEEEYTENALDRIESVLMQCSLRSVQEWELFFGVRRVQASTAAEPPPQTASNTKIGTPLAHPSSFHDFKTSSFGDYWNVVCAVVDEMYQKDLLSRETLQKLKGYGIDLFWLVHVVVVMSISLPLCLFSSENCITSHSSSWERITAFVVSYRMFLDYGAERWKSWIASKLGVFISKNTLCGSHMRFRGGEMDRGVKAEEPIEEITGRFNGTARSEKAASVASSSSCLPSKATQNPLLEPLSAVDVQHFNRMATISTKCAWMLLQSFYHPLSILSEE